MKLFLLLWLSFAPGLAHQNHHATTAITGECVATGATSGRSAFLLLPTLNIDGFEYGHWTFAPYRESQQAQLNSLGQQGWIECFPHKTEIYCSRTTPWDEEWSARVEWKSWEIGKWTNIATLLGEAGKVDYDQCFVWNAKRLWCSQPLNN